VRVERHAERWRGGLCSRVVWVKEEYVGVGDERQWAVSGSDLARGREKLEAFSVLI
jgi:hypothetical protein